MSMPAVVPHCRPAGNWPQLRETVGAGFGRPSPVIGLPAEADAADCAEAAGCASPAPPAAHAVRSSVLQTARTDRTGRDVDMGLLEKHGSDWSDAGRRRC